MITKLDELITSLFTEINDNVRKHAKLGDLIRMIELRQKLLPDNSSQREFWKMMEQIRREQLPADGKGARNKQPLRKKERAT
ncbi:hypothetical protein GF420_07860 [candidate division GN15 bacterium]|nr:hypothetical protein [candidate division GN15 bacterium]